MAFTVGLSGGTKDFEFEAYVRLLEKDGVNIADVPRVCDPHSGNRWLYAWSGRAEAEEFAARLREETGEQDWQVHELPGVEPSRGPLGPLEILVGRQSDGCTFSLQPTSRKLVRRRFPQAKPTTSVFISSDTRPDCGAGQANFLDQVAIILTGLSREQIDEMGGYRVNDPAANAPIAEASASAHAS